MNKHKPSEFFAFISYNSKDTKWGKRLQKKLEGYRMPTTLCSERGWERKPINPVFFAPYDIQPGGLNAELQERLKASKHLIVICSPNSAQSEWVGKEIAFFHSLGRTENIHFFIIDGFPNSGDSKTECFNPVVKELGIPEILGANIHEKVFKRPWLNRERAYVQLITKLLGVEFDSLWQRHRRMLRQKFALWIAGILTVLATVSFVYVKNLPVDVTLSLTEASTPNDNLPPMGDGVVTLTLGKEVKTDTIANINQKGTFLQVPQKYLGKEVRVTFACRDFLPVDTMLVLNKDILLPVRRDSTVYGCVRFGIWQQIKEQYLPGARVSVDGIEAVSDSQGIVQLYVPLARQKTSYAVVCHKPYASDSIIMPTGDSDAFVVE